MGDGMIETVAQGKLNLLRVRNKSRTIIFEGKQAIIVLPCN